MFFLREGFRSLLILLMCWGFSSAETPMKMGVRLGVGLSFFDDHVTGLSDGELMGVGLEGAYGVLMPIGLSVSFHPELAFQYTYVENNVSNISLTEMNLLLSPLFRYDWSRMFFELGPSMNWNIYNEWGTDYASDPDRQISFGAVAGPGFKISEQLEIGVRYLFWWMPYEKKDVGNNNFFGIQFNGSYWF